MLAFFLVCSLWQAFTVSASPPPSTITSAATMTASRTQYIVYASTKVDAISIGNQINSTVGHPGSVRYLKPDDGHGIPAMWLVPQYSRDVSSAGLKKSEASAIGKLPGVSAVFPDRVVSKRAPSTSVAAISATPDFKPPITCSTDAARAEETPIVQWLSFPLRRDGLDVPIELRSIAQPQGVNPAGVGGLLNYVYRPPAGEGTWVYMIDSGVNRNHPVRIRSIVLLHILPSTLDLLQLLSLR